MASNEKHSFHIPHRCEGLQQGVRQTSPVAQVSIILYCTKSVDYFLIANPRPILQLEVHVLNPTSDDTSLVGILQILRKPYCKSGVQQSTTADWHNSQFILEQLTLPGYGYWKWQYDGLVTNFDVQDYPVNYRLLVIVVRRGILKILWIAVTMSHMYTVVSSGIIWMMTR